MKTWRDGYDEVIQSFRWKGLKMRLLSERGKVCGRCHKQRWPLELHHKTYERLGSERDEDLELLCGECHEAADSERADEGRKRSADALYRARLEGWATKKYGEEWSWRMDECEVAEEFDAWAENRDD